LTDFQSQRSAVLNNELALAKLNNSDFATAADYLKLAFQLGPADEAIGVNYVDTMLRLSRSQEALATVTERASKFQQISHLKALQARLSVEQGDPVKAREILADLFSHGYYDEHFLLLYVNLVDQTGALDEGRRVLDALVERQPTVLARRYRAGLYSRTGQIDKA